MKDSQILSTFKETAFLPESAPEPVPTAQSLVCDACRVGVVLRAVLFVEVVVAVLSIFGAITFRDWLTRLSLITSAALPATLLWLIVTCGLKRWLIKLKPALQQGLSVVLGALAGLYGCALLVLLGLVESAPWLASGASGAGLSALLVAELTLRARGLAPAAAAARLVELQARIRPHFLFNTLNSAIALVRAEPRKAEHLLEDLSELFRYALAEQGASVTLASEIALAQRYLAIEQVRFGDRIQVQWALDERAAGALLPPLLLQPLVENAVKHGVEPSAGGARIRVSTQRRGSVAVIKVSNTVDDGGALAPPGHGLALANVAERLALLHDVQGQFRAGLKDGVFQVRIEVPL
ncbi:MAG: histidine kinase [Rhodoferax sp.]|nr:histidine kinase [Rhodoferax sp.]